MSAKQQLSFVKLIQKYNVILSKSQLPDVRKAKDKKEYDLITNSDITTLSIIKKVHNMKRDVKNKADINKTGKL